MNFIGLAHKYQVLNPIKCDIECFFDTNKIYVGDIICVPEGDEFKEREYSG